MPDHFKQQPFAVTGLGVGMLACIGTENQHFDFFEINPDVITIATNKDYFSYLTACPPKANLILGDGRLELHKQPDHQYALLVMDAFSSDSVPMHLITSEAVAMYAKKVLKDEGIIAFHVTNRHLTFIPFLSRIAANLGWEGYSFHGDSDFDQFKFRSIWFVMLPPNSPWKQHLLDIGYNYEKPDPNISLWTDAYSNILPALHW